MSTTLKIVIGIAVFNTILGLMNLFLVPAPYKMYVNLFMFGVIAVEMVLGSIIIHAPIRGSK